MNNITLVFLVAITIIILFVCTVFLANVLFKWKKKPEIKIYEKKITNKPTGKGGQDDKNTLDDIANKYNLDS